MRQQFGEVSRVSVHLLLLDLSQYLIPPLILTQSYMAGYLCGSLTPVYTLCPVARWIKACIWLPDKHEMEKDRYIDRCNYNHLEIELKRKWHTRYSF